MKVHVKAKPNKVGILEIPQTMKEACLITWKMHKVVKMDSELYNQVL